MQLTLNMAHVHSDVYFSFFHSGTHILACLYLNKTCYCSHLDSQDSFLKSFSHKSRTRSHRPCQGRTRPQHNLAQNQSSDKREESQTSFTGYSEHGPLYMQDFTSTSNMFPHESPTWCCGIVMFLELANSLKAGGKPKI